LFVVANLQGPGLFTQTFAFAIGAAKDWGLPGAPYLLAVALLALAIALALVATRDASVSAAATETNFTLCPQHGIASEATWADRYRDSNNRRDRYETTKRWHFVDLEITDPDMKAACFGRKPLPTGTLASNGTVRGWSRMSDVMSLSSPLPSR
jgi:hypothetical protein